MKNAELKRVTESHVLKQRIRALDARLKRAGSSRCSLEITPRNIRIPSVFQSTSNCSPATGFVLLLQRLSTWQSHYSHCAVATWQAQWAAHSAAVARVETQQAADADADVLHRSIHQAREGTKELRGYCNMVTAKVESELNAFKADVFDSLGRQMKAAEERFAMQELERARADAHESERARGMHQPPKGGGPVPKEGAEACKVCAVQ
jgi:hypothetical protein